MNFDEDVSGVDERGVIVMNIAYDLERFKKAQELMYPYALKEMQNGRKKTHWIWFVFPQIKGLGSSPTAQRYAIVDLGEAKAYLADNLLRSRLLEISNALLDLPEKNIRDIMGSPDDMKLRSSMTLFKLAEPTCDVFQKVLDKYFGGELDEKTLTVCDAR